MITQGPRFEWYQQVEGGDESEPAPAPVLSQAPAPEAKADAPPAEGSEAAAPEAKAAAPVATATDSKVRWRFRLVAEKHDKVLRSQPYKSLQACLDGIQSVKANAVVEHRYERKKEGNTYSFNLVAPNHEVIGTGETCPTERQREDNIAAVKAHGPSALVFEVPK